MYRNVMVTFMVVFNFQIEKIDQNGSDSISESLEDP